MSSKAETIKENTPSILATLGVGAIITINQGNSEAYVAPINETQFAIAMGSPPPGGVKSTFVITMYEFNGSNEAKISLQPLGMEGYYWAAGQNAAGLTYPIVLGSNPGQFILTGSPDGTTIQNTFSPPGPYIHGYALGIKLLTYGHDLPLLQGLFNIEVVG